jgi:solute carrier family 39 (zinc transporter), member 1/2/3
VSLIYYKIIAALLIFLVSIVTAAYPLKKKAALSHPESIELGEALASGIFLGAAFFHLLPESIQLFSQVYGSIRYPVPEVICLGGFLLMLFLERLSIIAPLHHAKRWIPSILTIIVIIHALMEGAVLGMGQALPDTTLLFIAILAHKGSESFALCVTMIKHQLPRARIIFLTLFFALMSPLGICIGIVIMNESLTAQHGALIAACFNAFAAGTFIYISTLHHIRFHKHTEETQGMLELGCLVLGLVCMGVIAWWV